MTLTLLTPPTDFPVTLAEAKAHCRVYSSTDEDSLITTYIRAASRHVERELGLSITEQQWQLTQEGFCSTIDLQNGPVIAVDDFTYLDADGAEQTVDAGLYRVNGNSIVLNSGSTWPATSGAVNAVSVTYTTGFDGTPDDDLKAAILLLVGHWFANREAVNVGNTPTEVPFAVDALMQNYRKVLV